MRLFKSLCTHCEQATPTCHVLTFEPSSLQVLVPPGVECTPLPVVAYWKCEDTTTDYRLDYKYNPHCMSNPATLKNVNVMVGVSGGAGNMQSLPPGEWWVACLNSSSLLGLEFTTGECCTLWDIILSTRFDSQSEKTMLTAEKNQCRKQFLQNFYKVDILHNERHIFLLKKFPVFILM